MIVQVLVRKKGGLCDEGTNCSENFVSFLLFCSFDE